MKNISRNTIYIALGTLITGVLLGWLLFGKGSSGDSGHDHAMEQVDNITYTCAMHPHVRKSEPGSCPICGMDLIPLNALSDEAGPAEISMSPTAMQLANVRTSIVSREKPVKEVRLNGRVQADERLVFSQSSHIPGRIEKLMINFTGESVRKGQVLATVYSPELVTAQEELFETRKIMESQPQLFKAAKSKLLNWKLTESQIDRILEQGTPQERFPILADVSGVVLRKNVNLGDYVTKGHALFEVADLSRVWVLFDVYESDLAWVNKGDEVDFTIQSLPGDRFKGKITFIDPFINPKTRVATARVELKNPLNKLKPDMFAVGVTRSPIENLNEEIIVPKSAIMWTGERSVVYVKRQSGKGVHFSMQEVRLGPALGDRYIVLEGLTEGQEIATNGTFSIDAAAQLAGKPSMMDPTGGVPAQGHQHGHSADKPSSTPMDMKEVDEASIGAETRSRMNELFKAYIDVKDALVADQFESGKEAASGLRKKLHQMKALNLKGDARDLWLKAYRVSDDALGAIEKAENIGEVRRQFRLISDQFILLAVTFGPFTDTLYIQHCPMANDNKGADWISGEKRIQNPYFGAQMLGCGEVTKEIK